MKEDLLKPELPYSLLGCEHRIVLLRHQMEFWNSSDSLFMG